MTQEPKVVKFTSWDEFGHSVRNSSFVARRAFRGHRCSDWKLSSHWERWLLKMKSGDLDRSNVELFSEGALEPIRDSYLKRFQERAIGLSGVPTDPDANKTWWALGRHHGLTTPILDWSFSPYIAAYFAFIDLADNLNPGLAKGTHSGGIKFGTGYIAVWELTLDESVFKEGEFEWFIEQSVFGYRQKAQQGLFTQLTHDTHADIESYLKSKDSCQFLCRYEIPRQNMGRALWDLELMGIDPATMFPDLGGAASVANLWNMFETIGSSNKPMDYADNRQSNNSLERTGDSATEARDVGDLGVRNG